MASRPCSVDGCTLPYFGRGFCRRHYNRWRTHGDPNKVMFLRVPPGLSTYEAVIAHSEWEGDCLVFKGNRNSQGYGQIRDRERKIKTVRAHRVVMEHHNGPSDLWVLHSCDNPSCVNIDHLRYGTPEDNYRDSMSGGAHINRARHGR